MDQEKIKEYYEKINNCVRDCVGDYIDSYTLENVEYHLRDILGMPQPKLIKLTEKELSCIGDMDEDNELCGCFSSDYNFISNEENNEKLEKVLNKWLQRTMNKVKNTDK